MGTGDGDGGRERRETNGLETVMRTSKKDMVLKKKAMIKNTNYNYDYWFFILCIIIHNKTYMQTYNITYI